VSVDGLHHPRRSSAGHRCSWSAANSPDERLREVSGWFGFKYVELLIAELPDANLDSFENDAAWYLSFLRRIAG